MRALESTFQRSVLGLANPGSKPYTPARLSLPRQAGGFYFRLKNEDSAPRASALPAHGGYG